MSLLALRVIKVFYNPPVSHFWGSTTCWRVADTWFGKWCFQQDILPSHNVFPGKRLSDSMYFRKACLFSISYDPCCYLCKKTLLNSKLQENHCAIALPHLWKWLARNYHVLYFIRLSFNTLENTEAESVTLHTEFFLS